MSDVRTAYLYELVFPDGMRYVGKTLQGVDERWRKHQDSAKRDMPQVICRAIRKHGAAAVTVNTLCIGTHDYIREMECKAIAVFDCRVPNGYNVALGGDAAPSSAPEVAAKIGASLRGKAKSEQHRKRLRAANLGKTHSVETREKMSAAKRGRVVSSDTIARMRQASTGRRHSPETKARLAALATGRIASAETRQKMSLAHKGKRAAHGYTAEVRATMSINRRGKGRSNPIT